MVLGMAEISAADQDKTRLASLILRLGLAFAFLYAAISSLINPLAWAGFIPFVVKGIIPERILLTSFSIFQIFLGLWLVSGKKVFYAAVVSALTLAVITVANLNSLIIVFRDITILFSAVALAALSKGRE